MRIVGSSGMANVSVLARLTLLLTVTCVIAGCGGQGGIDLTSVTGTVTSDGQPLAGADVTFMPVGEEGSPSAGTTDASGNFDLKYSDGRSGAALGSHQVVITLGGGPTSEPTEGGGEEGGSGGMMVMPEPVEYYKTAEVTADGENKFTFEVME